MVASFKLECRRELGVAWRMKIAGEGEPFHGSQCDLDDDYVAWAQEFNAASRSEGQEAAEKLDPAFTAAKQLQDDPEMVVKLKYLVLAGFSSSAMSHLLGPEAHVISLWKNLSFDVEGLEHEVHLLDRLVIHPEDLRGDAAVAKNMRLAFIGDVDGVRKIFDAKDGSQNAAQSSPHDEAGQLFRQLAELHAEREAVLSTAFHVGRLDAALTACHRLSVAERGVKAAIADFRQRLPAMTYYASLRGA